jgi:hypothetical protein
LVEWNDPRVVVAIFAAVVATISLVWNIVVSIKKNNRIVRINIIPKMVLTKDRLTNAFYPAIGVLDVQATSYTNDDIYIEGWYIKLSKKINLMRKETDMLSCVDPDGSIKYPYLLKKGDVFKDFSGVRNIINAIGNQLPPESKMQVYVSDTFKNVFKSRKFEYKCLLDLLETENIARETHINNVTGNTNFHKK